MLKRKENSDDNNSKLCQKEKRIDMIAFQNCFKKTRYPDDDLSKSG